jgi:creatinine amidohydrolase
MPSPASAYVDRYLGAMTPRRIATLPDKAWAPVILSTAAIEQHGPHLPVQVDALMGEVWMSEIAARLPEGASCYFAPQVTVGKSNEHLGFPGTLGISKESLRSLVFAAARQVQAWGFRRLAVINSHGGNLSVVKITLAEIQAELGLATTLIRYRFGTGLSAEERAFGFHAGEVETAWLLAVAPHLVRMDKAVREFPAGARLGSPLLPEAAPATYAWITRDISRSGILGDAPAATAENGRRWISEAAADIVATIARLCAEARAQANP